MTYLKTPLATFVYGIVVGVAVTSVLAFSITFPRLEPLTSSSTTTTTASTAALPPQSGAVSVHDQPAGDSVTVESVTVPPPGVWVAVQELGANDALGNVLGAARVHGPLQNVTVQLLRGTETGKRYAVVLYRDDSNGAFDLHDSVYVDFDTGARVEAPFTAQ